MESLPLLTGFAFHAGRTKGKSPAGEKLPLLAVQCLEALLTLGRTAQGVTEVLQDVPLAEDHVPVASDAGVHRQCCFCCVALLVAKLSCLILSRLVFLSLVCFLSIYFVLLPIR